MPSQQEQPQLSTSQLVSGTGTFQQIILYYKPSYPIKKTFELFGDEGIWQREHLRVQSFAQYFNICLLFNNHTSDVFILFSVSIS